jgi:hypothetical protein
MKYDVETAKALLGRTPSTLQTLLQELPPTWLDASGGTGAWSAREVACHLADLEHDAWIPRARFILEHATTAPLPVIERERFRERYADAPLNTVLADFERLRADNLADLQGLALDPAALRLAGLHDALGPVTLAQLLSAWVVHDLNHLSQITRVLAEQYRDAVGPWATYMSILSPREPVGP